jgi:hypothetical protein
VAIPVRKNQEFADNQLHKQAKLAIMENNLAPYNKANPV